VSVFARARGIFFYQSRYGYGAAKKLKALKGSVGDEVAVRQTFARFDSDGDGKVSVAEFASLLQAIGCELTHHELEAAVAIVGDMSDRTVGRRQQLCYLSPRSCVSFLVNVFVAVDLYAEVAPRRFSFFTFR